MINDKKLNDLYKQLDVAMEKFLMEADKWDIANRNVNDIEESITKPFIDSLQLTQSLEYSLTHHAEHIQKVKMIRAAAEYDPRVISAVAVADNQWDVRQVARAAKRDIQDHIENLERIERSRLK